MEKLIHILFDEKGAEALQKSFQLDDIIEGTVEVLGDDLSAGPLASLPEEEGGMTREAWRNMLRPEGADANPPSVEKIQLITDQLQADPNTEAWIWAAQNARDVCAYYALTDPLSPFQGRVHLIYLNNLPFINEKGTIFYPDQLSRILPKEFLKARKLAREITVSEFEIDREEWGRQVKENHPLRILEGGKKITGQKAEFFDKELLSNVGKDFQKAFRVITHFQHKAKNFVSEEYLLWRLRELARSGALEYKGELLTAKDFDVKLKSDDPDQQVGKDF